MKEHPHDSVALICEIERYLAAVDSFRTERCEPTWLPELAPRGAAQSSKARGEQASPAQAAGDKQSH